MIVNALPLIDEDATVLPKISSIFTDTAPVVAVRTFKAFVAGLGYTSTFAASALRTLANLIVDTLELLITHAFDELTTPNISPVDALIAV